MKVRVFATAVLVAALAVVAVGATGASGSSSANTLTVWLQTDAQNGWSDLVASANAQFKKDHPGVDVNVQYQQWTTHLQKFDATLAGGNAPDVIEMGNTEMTKYMAAGAFQDLTSSRGSFDNSGNWLAGMQAGGPTAASSTASRTTRVHAVVTYRTDLFKKAGIKTAPTSLAQFTAAAKKLAATNSTKGFSPVYIAGPDWYVAMSFVYDYGGQIAVTRQRQVGRHARLAEVDRRPDRIQELLRRRLSREQDDGRGASVPVHGLRPGPRRRDARRRVGHAAASATSTRSVSTQFVMPSHTKGKPMPGFLGGSRPRRAGRRQQGARRSTGSRPSPSTASMRALQAKGNIPNATNLLGNSVNERAAANSWFVPTGEELGQRRERQRPPQHADADPHRQADGQAGGVLRERQHHVGPERIGVMPNRGRPRCRVAAPRRNDRRRSPPPGFGGVAVSRGIAWFGPSPRTSCSCRCSWSSARCSWYPLYKLVTLSFQHYGLFELIQRKGKWIGFDNYGSVLHDAVFWDTLCGRSSSRS